MRGVRLGATEVRVGGGSVGIDVRDDVGNGVVGDGFGVDMLLATVSRHSFCGTSMFVLETEKVVATCLGPKRLLRRGALKKVVEPFLELIF